jgi:hypothetical protein
VFGVTGQVPPVFGVTGQALSPGQATATTATPALPTPLPVTATTVVSPLMPIAALASPTPLPHTVTTVVPPVTPLQPSPQPAPPVVLPTVHFDDSATSFTQHGRSPTLNTSTSILSISDDYKSSLTLGYPYITSNPTVTINRLSILFNFLAGCPGLLNANGTISYGKLHVVLAGKCYPNHSASSAGFGSTLTLDYLNTLAEALSPILVSSRTPQSLEDTVNIIS